MEQMTNNQLNIGTLSVNIFFIISGYLIMISLKNSKTAINYLWKRFLRLFPALFVMLLITLLILIIVYTGENIFLQKDFYTYLPRNLTLYKVQYAVKGVFENLPYPNAINGSLWSLCYEFSMYLVILSLFPLKKKKIALFILIGIGSFCFFTSNFYPKFLNEIAYKVFLSSDHFYRLTVFFIGGAILSYFNLKKINKPYVKTGLAIVLIVALFFNLYKPVAFIVLPVLILLIGISYSKKLNYIPHKIGDISYGVYIYGFIVQQTFMNYYHFSPIILTIVSLSVTYVLAFFSWKYIEKPILIHKNYIK